jgi:hypothetical protein
VPLNNNFEALSEVLENWLNHHVDPLENVLVMNEILDVVNATVAEYEAHGFVPGSIILEKTFGI